MSAEWIAKLTAKSICITGEGFGGTAQVTWGDIAASLSGTNRLGYLLLLAKYADDRKANSLFIGELAKEIKKEKNCTINIALRVATACAFPVIHPMRCVKCHGRTLIFSKKKSAVGARHSRTCPVCRGTGYRRLSDRRRAEIAGIPSSTWHDSWKGYCNKKENFLWMIEDDTIKHLRFNMGDAA